MAAQPQTMQAVSCPQYGSYKNIVVTERTVPSPKEKEILVRVSYTAITTADTMMRAGNPRFARVFLGLPKPRNPYLGTGYSGEIIKVGKNVKNYAPGDLIFGESGLKFSANAEYVCIDSEGVVFHKPSFLSHEQAACFCDGPLTSYNFIKEIGRAKKGHKILINGGAGSLGTAAIQIAKNFGCHVVATSRPENFSFLKGLGADQIIDYNSDEFKSMSDNFDIVYDTVGKLKFSQAKKYLAKNGSFISPVLSLNLLFNVLAQKIKRSKMTASFSATGIKKPSELAPFVSDLLEYVEKGNLNVHIEKVFSLKEIPTAHGLIDDGHKKGSFVAEVSN